MSAGLMAADAAVRMGLTSGDRLVDEASRRRCGYPAHRVAELASEHSESPGESWTRLVLAGLGFGAEQQVPIHDGDEGSWPASTSSCARERVVVEFDGAVKYAGADGRDAPVREKRREDALRALGCRVVRLTRADLSRPERILAMIGRVAA